MMRPGVTDERMERDREKEELNEGGTNGLGEGRAMKNAIPAI
jgi:hypothetical protein